MPELPRMGLMSFRLRGRTLRLDLVLLLIMAVGALWRLGGLDWGWTDFDPVAAAEGRTGAGTFYAFHPDEASNIRAAKLFTQSDSWRPTGELYGEKVDYSLYGASTIYLHVLAVKLRALVGDIRPYDESDPASFRATWLAVRWLTALLGLACLPLLYWAALSLYGLGAARLAALLLAGAAFHAQSGRFGTVDMPMLFFCLWSLAHSARLLTRRSRWDLLLAALAAGLAVSTKINAVLVVLPLVVAELLREPLPAGARLAAPALLRRLCGRRLWGAAAVTVGVFLLLNPYALLDWRTYLFADNAFGLVHILHNVRGDFFYPFQIQFEDIHPLPFLVGNVLWWAAGPPLLIAGLGSWAWLAWRRRPADLLLLSWALPSLLLTAGAKVLFMRYAIPFLPLLALGAAAALAELLERWPSGSRRALAWVLAAAVALPSLAWTSALASVHDVEDSRISAGRYLAARLPAGAALLHERSANSIKPVIHMPRYHNVCEEIPTVYRATGCSEAEKLDFLLDRLRQVDWAAILESNRKLGYDRSSRYPAERAFYQELFAGRLGFATDTVFQTLPAVLGQRIDDEPAEFSLRYYDHEEIHVLRKTDPAALERRGLELKEGFRADPATVDGRLERAGALLAGGDLNGAYQAATEVLKGERGQARALLLLARVFEQRAAEQLAAGDGAGAGATLRDADGLCAQSVQLPTAPLGQEARMAEWVGFHARLGDREGALGLLDQARRLGWDGPELAAAAAELGAPPLALP